MTTDQAKINQAAAAAQWYMGLKETNNKHFLPLFFDESRYLVLKGGGGSGKSIFAGRKLIERCISEPNHRFLVCRKVAKTLRESCFIQLCTQASDYASGVKYTVNRTDMSIRFDNGSEILFAGLDDVEKLKSIYNITGIWIEEASELLEADFNQLDIRLRGETAYYKQIIVSFNPINIMHWLKKRFFDSPDPRATVSETTYLDNRFLDEESRKVLEGFRDTDEYYYMVYCLGQWGVTGRTVFNGKDVTERLAQNIQPVRRGLFEYDYDGLSITNIRWTDAEDGFVMLYKEPEADRPYAIGGDTAGDGSDSFVGQVIDNITTEQVCTLRHGFDEDLYAHQMYCLGVYYNNALVGIETNFSSYPVRELERLNYPKQYVRESMDTYTHKPKQSYGFRTDSKTRPVIIAELVKACREDITIINNKETLEEMLTFVRSESYKPEAEEGAHDDCIMALAIAHYIRPQQSMTLREPEQETVRWTDDMWEDYNRADSDLKKYLIKKWGNPKK